MFVSESLTVKDSFVVLIFKHCVAVNGFFISWAQHSVPPLADPYGSFNENQVTSDELPLIQLGM